jgi:hypothetical protein
LIVHFLRFGGCAARIHATSFCCSSWYSGFLSSRRFAVLMLWHAFLSLGLRPLGLLRPCYFLHSKLWWLSLPSIVHAVPSYPSHLCVPVPPWPAFPPPFC